MRTCCKRPWKCHILSFPLAVASLALVSPGAATNGVTPIISSQNWRPFFCSSLSLFYFTRVSPPWRVSPGPFLPVRSCFSTVLCTFSHYFSFIRVSPLEGVTRGGPPSPLSDATAHWNNFTKFDLTKLIRSWLIMFYCWVIHNNTPWPWPLTFWPWTLECIGCHTIKLFAEF